jgi:hypothetical protein
MSSFRKTLLCLAACVALLSSPCAAEDDDNRLDDAWEDAIGDQEPILTPKQFAVLNNLAFQAAASKVCDGFKLSGDKFAKEFADVTSTPNEGISDEEAAAWNAAVLIRFGTTYGLLLAEGNADEGEFCKSAKELKADSKVPNVWE